MTDNNIKDIDFSKGLKLLAEIIDECKGDKPTRVFARHLNVSYMTLNRILEGKTNPDLATIYKIAKHSRYTLTDLVEIICSDSDRMNSVKTSEEILAAAKKCTKAERAKVFQGIFNSMTKDERKKELLKLVDIVL